MIFIIITGWIFSGWPQIWNNPPFPPKIQQAQAAVSFVGSAVNSSSPNTATSVTLPGGMATDDLIIVAAGVGDTANNGMAAPTQGGYTRIGAATIYSNDVNDVNLDMYYKFHNGSDTAVSFGAVGGTNASNVAVVMVFRGVDTSSPFDTTVSTASGINTSNADPPSHNWSGAAGVWTVAIGATGHTGTASATFTAPTGYTTNFAFRAHNDTIDALVGMGYKSSPADPEDPGVFTAANIGTAADNAWAAATISLKPQAATTFLGNDTNPGVNPTIAPEAATTTVGTFNLRTNTGTDTVTNATTTLSAGSSGGLFGVEITNTGNTTIYCSSYNPSSDTVGLTGCNLPVTNASTTFNIRIKPKTHSAMPGPPGSTYSVTATITAITATNNSTSGADTTSDTVTIDNASPNGATAISGSAGNAKVTINWTTSNSSDFDTASGSVVLRWAAGSAGSEVPVEGKSNYAAGDTITTATVACVISSAASTAQTKIDGTGGDTGCTTAALTNGQQYTYVAFQRDTSGNYDAGVSIGTFTPVATSLTFTIDTSSVSFVSTVTPGTPVSTSSVLTINTTNSSGYNIKIERASTTPTLFIFVDNATTTIADTPNGNNWTAPGSGTATTTAGPSAIWTDSTTKSLGFRVKSAGTNSGAYHSAWWGTSDASANALYSGISTSSAAQIFSKNNVGTGSNENITVEYRIDVITSQRSGTYISSPVTYTATVNP